MTVVNQQPPKTLKTMKFVKGLYPSTCIYVPPTQLASTFPPHNLHLRSSHTTCIYVPPTQLASTFPPHNFHLRSPHTTSIYVPPTQLPSTFPPHNLHLRSPHTNSIYVPQLASTFPPHNLHLRSPHTTCIYVPPTQLASTFPPHNLHTIVPSIHHKILNCPMVTATNPFTRKAVKGCCLCMYIEPAELAAFSLPRNDQWETNSCDNSYQHRPSTKPVNF